MKAYPFLPILINKSGEKAADSWAKKIYEDNHGAFSYSYGGSEKNMVLWMSNYFLLSI
jgi:hypothetical protein